MSDLIITPTSGRGRAAFVRESSFSRVENSLSSKSSCAQATAAAASPVFKRFETSSRYFRPISAENSSYPGTDNREKPHMRHVTSLPIFLHIAPPPSAAAAAPHIPFWASQSRVSPPLPATDTMSPPDSPIPSSPEEEESSPSRPTVPIPDNFIISDSDNIVFPSPRKGKPQQS